VDSVSSSTATRPTFRRTSPGQDLGEGLPPAQAPPRTLQRRSRLALCVTSRPRRRQERGGFRHGPAAGLLHASSRCISLQRGDNDKASPPSSRAQRVGTRAPCGLAPTGGAGAVRASRRSSSAHLALRRGGEARPSSKARLPPPQSSRRRHSRARAPLPQAAQPFLAEVTTAYNACSPGPKPASRLKALLNDIGNRTVNFGYRRRPSSRSSSARTACGIDERGRVSRTRMTAAPARASNSACPTSSWRPARAMRDRLDLQRGVEQEAGASGSSRNARRPNPRAPRKGCAGSCWHRQLILSIRCWRPPLQHRRGPFHDPMADGVHLAVAALGGLTQLIYVGPL